MSEVAAPLVAETKPSRASAVSRVAIAAVLVSGIAWALGHRDSFKAEVIESHVSALGPWAPLGFVAAYAVATVLFLPGSALTLVGGAVFGPVLGAIYSLVGATLGAALSFVIARYLAGDWVARRARGRVRDLVDGVGARGWRFVAFVRLVPLLPFNLLNYALALTPIRFVPYVFTSFVCMIPGAFAYAWLGHAGRTAVGGDEGSVRAILIAVGLLGALSLLPAVIRRREPVSPSA